jgi:hypothetical protein
VDSANVLQLRGQIALTSDWGMSSDIHAAVIWMQDFPEKFYLQKFQGFEFS